ncbi:MAG: CYTH domain-containing protein [Dysgonamonadaceae bacterium]|jgi:CYTH domain-containing protein|nr:CYTH domain-containing protein [Dysgonamonadaceae bacterium]
MPYEIERKFLVKGDYKPFVTQQTRIAQGYLSLVRERIVRVRVKGDKGYLTIKSEVPDSEFSRYEWEREIPLSDAEDMLRFCEKPIIDKTRHLVPVGKHVYEVDEFYGDNEGLTMAEVELASEDEAFEKPDWLGDEVTMDRRYYNSYLTRHPYKEWK